MCSAVLALHVNVLPVGRRTLTSFCRHLSLCVILQLALHANILPWSCRLFCSSSFIINNSIILYLVDLTCSEVHYYYVCHCTGTSSQSCLGPVYQYALYCIGTSSYTQMDILPVQWTSASLYNTVLALRCSSPELLNVARCLPMGQ